MNTKSLKILFALFLAFSLLTGCDKDDDDNQDNSPKDVSLKFYFNHRIGNAQLLFDSVAYQNDFGNVYGVSTLKYFVSDFTLHKDDGSTYLIDEAHYVDGRDNATRTFTPSGKIPAGTYNSLTFVFGLTEEKNVDGTYPDPPENQMEWPPAMGHGYHYMKLEGKFEMNGGSYENFQAHTGASMNNPYFIEVELPMPLVVAAGDEKIVSLRMDINKWWSSPNELDLNEVSGIMGNPAMQEKLKANGADVFSLESIE
ncbi:MAG: hypothetical protein KDC05_02235 [Bacteroidales bacterium]|nr:hypothetical protein [Bacteroidales bacterium]